MSKEGEGYPCDSVNHPLHYTKGKIETIDLIEEIVQHYPDPVIGGCVWQVIKYVSRAPHKANLVEDLAKASWYLNRAINHAKKTVENS